MPAEGAQLANFPLASELISNVLVYDGALLREGGAQREVEREFARAFSARASDGGPGIVAIRGAFSHEVVDAASSSFARIAASERRLRDDDDDSSGGGRDHFAPAGSNTRVWNALEKLACDAPETFVAYVSNPWLALAARAWLGPRYQVTSQVNIVHPGGEQQMPHRDYHLGFMRADEAAHWPAHTHRAVSFLTLQGAVAHSDMPLVLFSRPKQAQRFVFLVFWGCARAHLRSSQREREKEGGGGGTFFSFRVVCLCQDFARKCARARAGLGSDAVLALFAALGARVRGGHGT